jgi:hypothetical protein
MIVRCAFCKKDGAFNFTGTSLSREYRMAACLPCGLEKRMEIEEEVTARTEYRAFCAEVAAAEANAEGWANLIKLLGWLAVIIHDSTPFSISAQCTRAICLS